MMKPESWSLGRMPAGAVLHPPSRIKAPSLGPQNSVEGNIDQTYAASLQTQVRAKGVSVATMNTYKIEGLGGVAQLAKCFP